MARNNEQDWLHVTEHLDHPRLEQQTARLTSPLVSGLAGRTAGPTSAPDCAIYGLNLPSSAFISPSRDQTKIRSYTELAAGFPHAKSLRRAGLRPQHPRRARVSN